MKIGIVTTWFERGAAYVSKQYAEVLEMQGNEVFIYARSGEEYAKGDPNWDKENVYWSKRYSFPIFNYTDSDELSKWAKEKDLEAVIFNEQYWLKNVIALKEVGVKVGAYIDYYTEDMLQTFKVYDFLLCNTEKHYTAFKDIHPQAFYLPWGTDVKLYDTSHMREKCDKVRFFHSAGMSGYRKGTDLAVKAYLKLPEDKLNQCKLIIHAQRDPFTSLNDDEKSVVKQLISSGNIEIIEETVSAPGLYHLGDVYVYPSRLDGIGLTVAEAIAAGMPVIVPDDKPMNEFVTPDSYKVKIDKFFCRADAYYWPMNEVDLTSLTYAYCYYIDNNDKLNEFTSNARSKALESYSFNKNMESLSSVINSASHTPYNDVEFDVVKYTNKRFPKLYELEKFYKFAYAVYKRVK